MGSWGRATRWSPTRTGIPSVSWGRSIPRGSRCLPSPRSERIPDLLADRFVAEPAVDGVRHWVLELRVQHTTIGAGAERGLRHRRGARRRITVPALLRWRVHETDARHTADRV